MKKLFLVALVAMFSLSLMAKDVVVPKFKCFVPNNQQKCEQTFTFPTGKTAQQAFEAVKSIVNANDFISTIDNVTETGFTFAGVLQTESSYNPMVNISFRSTLSMKGVVTYADGQVTIKLTDFFVDEQRSGWGIDQKRFDVNTLISDIERLQNTIPTASGKEKKQAKEDLEDKVDVLADSDEELYKRMMLVKDKLTR